MRAQRIVAGALLASVIAVACAEDRAHAEESTTFYGWEIAPVIAVSGGFYAGARLSDKDNKGAQVLYGTGAFTVGLFGGAFVHFLNGRPTDVSKRAMQIAFAGAAAGALIGFVVDKNVATDHHYGRSALFGAEVGMLGAAAIDMLAFGWAGNDDETGPKQPAPVMSTTIMPTVGPTIGGATVGLAGAF